MWCNVLIMMSMFIRKADLFCPLDAFAGLPFVLEYAVWRGWHQSVIYAPELEKDCDWMKVRLVKCMSLNGIAASFDAMEKPRLQFHLGVVILMPMFHGNATENVTVLLKKLNIQEMNMASYDWLVSVRSDKDYYLVTHILNRTSIRFDQNIVVGYSRINRFDSPLGLCDNNFAYTNSKRYKEQQNNDEQRCQRDNSCWKLVHERNYYRASPRYRNLTKQNTYKYSGRIINLYQSGILHYNTSKPFEMTKITDFSLREELSLWRQENKVYENGVHVVQYFKVRANSTLYTYYLGYWSREYSMSGVDIPYPVDIRNFFGEELVVGRCNITNNGASSDDEEGPEATAPLDDVLNFLSFKLNSSATTRYYTKLGYRTYEGAWSGLLGALIDNTVDVALEPVTALPNRRDDMEFIFPIAGTMYNIYIRQQETSTARDIFMTPFSTYLVVSVVAIAGLAAAAIILISRLAPKNLSGSRVWPMEYTEALIWSTGILCQQGGPLTPQNPAASILLIVCLLFAVVTYNAYAAFITSVLSVRVASLDTVAAVLQSPNIKIGYIRNGADQMYLMTTKDTQLQAFYIRGYSNTENLVSSEEQGLARAAKQDYAFFANQRTARTTLRSLSQDRGRCAVKEVPVPSTRAQLAFPLPLRSPYARPILISLLQFHNTGAMARLQAALVPAMPECVPPPGFASARATDVKSALILIIVGMIMASLLGFAEYSWKKRKELQKVWLAVWRRVVNLFNECVN